MWWWLLYAFFKTYTTVLFRKGGVLLYVNYTSLLNKIPARCLFCAQEPLHPIFTLRGRYSCGSWKYEKLFQVHDIPHYLRLLPSFRPSLVSWNWMNDKQKSSLAPWSYKDSSEAILFPWQAVLTHLHLILPYTIYLRDICEVPQKCFFPCSSLLR